MEVLETVNDEIEKNHIDTYLYKGIFILITIIIAIILIKIIKKQIKKRIQKSNELKDAAKIDTALWILIRTILYIVVFVIATVLILSQFSVLDSILNTVLASSGIAAVAIGLAAQDALSSLISGISISINKPFQIGDTINLVTENIVGTVVDIRLRYTIISNYNNRRLLIPNEIMNKAIIENYRNGNKEICQFLEFSISYEDDIDKAIKIIKEEALKHKDLLIQEDTLDYPDVRVVKLGAMSVDLKVWLHAVDQSTGFAMSCDLRKSIKELFDKNGIVIPSSNEIKIYNMK